MYSIQSSNKISKGGGLWMKFSIKSRSVIGPNHSHVIKYWPLIGGEEKWFNWSLQREGVIENQETFKYNNSIVWYGTNKFYI